MKRVNLRCLFVAIFSFCWIAVPLLWAQNRDIAQKNSFEFSPLSRLSDKVSPSPTDLAFYSVYSRVVAATMSPDASLSCNVTPVLVGSTMMIKTCVNSGNELTFTNTSATISSNQSYEINWGDGSPVFTATSWTSVKHTYSKGSWNLVYKVVSMDNSVSTKTYGVFLGSNPSVAMGNPGNTDICVNTTLTFPITGTENNPPGTTYTVVFNDGTPSRSFDDSNPLPSSISHTFNNSSCGTSSSDGTITYQNSFLARITASNPCGQSAVGVMPIYVSRPPDAAVGFSSSPACLNTTITLSNATSNLSTVVNNGTSSTCATSQKAVWQITPSTGFTIVTGSLGSDASSDDQNLWTSGTLTVGIRFTALGTYTVRMRVGNRCGTAEHTRTLCVEPGVVPQFNVSAVKGCAPLTITTTNSTSTSQSCVPPSYFWSTTYVASNCGTTSSVTYVAGSAGSSAPTIRFNNPGTYTLKLTATNSCGSQTTTRVINVTKPPTVTLSPIADICGSDKIAPTATVTSCTPSAGTLQYHWSFPGGNPSTSTSANPGQIFYATPGTYSASLYVDNECGSSALATKSFNVYPVPGLMNTSLSQAACSGSPTTEVVLLPKTTGGTFTWTASGDSNVSGFKTSGKDTIPSQKLVNSSNVSGVVTYKIVPEQGSCKGDTVVYAITVYPSMYMSKQPVSDTVCMNRSTPPLSIAVDKAPASISYQWYSNTVKNTSTGIAISGATSDTYQPLTDTPGTTFYYCVATSSESGCNSLISDIANVDVLSSLSFDKQPLSSQQICVGGTVKAPLAIEVSGGHNLTYQWYSNTSNAISGGTKITGANSSTYQPPVFTQAGDYYFYVEINTEGTNCEGPYYSYLSQIKVLPDPIMVEQPVQQMIICKNGVADTLKVSATGGIGNFTYQWYKNGVDDSGSGTLIPGASQSYYIPETQSLDTMYYYCKITQPDGPDCSVTSNTSRVIVRRPPSISTFLLSESVCKDAEANSLVVSLNNAIGKSTFQWYKNTVNSYAGATPISQGNDSVFIPPTTTVGTSYYFCQVTISAIGCSMLTSSVVQIIVKPAPVISNRSVGICNESSFTVIPVNTGADIVPTGTKYIWSDPVISTPTNVVGASGQMVPQTQISQLLTNIGTKPETVTYNVTPIFNNCTGKPFDIVVTVYPTLMAKLQKKDITCFGTGDGSLSALVEGGNPFTTGNAYQYTWAGPYGFSSTKPILTGLSEGIYHVTIRDNTGCSIALIDTIVEPKVFALKTDLQKNDDCFGTDNGKILVSVTGGTLPYHFTWTKNGETYSTDEDQVNLGAGVYALSVTDAHGCGPLSQMYTITESTEMTLKLLKQQNNSCYGDSLGSISISVTGGTLVEKTPGVFGYLYEWTGPDGFTSSQQNLSHLGAGIYNLTVKDKTGCAENLSVNILQPSELKVETVITPVSCNGNNDGTIMVSAYGGVSPYEVKWSNSGSGFSQSDLSPGVYSIDVSDANSCHKVVQVVIEEPNSFTIQPTVKHVDCAGTNTGSINLNIKTGKRPVTINWSDIGQGGNLRTNLAPGFYAVEISDGPRCSIRETFIINEPDPLALSAKITNAFDCENPRSGEIALAVSGGTMPYQYQWSNGAKTDTVKTLTDGSYLVTVTDSKGCSASAQYAVKRHQALVVKVDTVVDFNCSTGKIVERCTAHVSGGVMPYRYVWSTGNPIGLVGDVMETDQSGMVLLQVTDGAGCKTELAFTTYIPPLGIDYRMEDCDRKQYQFRPLVPHGLTDMYTFFWDFGDGSTSSEQLPHHSFQKSGVYNVVLTFTGKSCGSSYTTQVVVEQKPVVTVSPAAIFCKGDSITVHASGAASYRWSDGSEGDSLVVKQSGDYSVVGIAKTGCTNTCSFKASYFNLFSFEAQSDRNEITSHREPVRFWTEEMPSTAYYWDFGDGTTDYGADLTHTFSMIKDGFFEVKLKVINSNGCVETSSKKIWVKAVDMPNSFSPNGDGKNDIFLSGWHIQVFNRTGVLLYDGSDGWDGTYKGSKVPNDTYYYIQYYSSEKGIKTNAGFVTIIR